MVVNPSALISYASLPRPAPGTRVFCLVLRSPPSSGERVSRVERICANVDSRSWAPAVDGPVGDKMVQGLHDRGVVVY